MVIFRENTEDIYAGIEWEAGTPEAQEGHRLPAERDEASRRSASRRRAASASSRSRSEGTERLVRAAIEYALEHKRKSVTLVHKGNIMKFTEGAFSDWGYAPRHARVPRPDRHRARELDPRQQGEERRRSSVEANAQRDRPRLRHDDARPAGQDRAEVETALALWPTHGDGKWKKKLLITRLHRRHHAPAGADARRRTSTSSPRSNLNGDYLSDALAAQVGGIGIAPGGNINYVTGHAIFEATHGTAPKYADLDKVNPGSVILSGEMMLALHGLERGRRPHHQGLEATIGAEDA